MTDTANTPERISDDDLRKLLDDVDGPWRVEDEHGRGNVLAKHGYEVCWDATARDARLIALAPDLAKERLEHATHCAELVAAAYLDAIEIMRMLPELMPMNADQVRAIEQAGNTLSRSGAPDNARAALTAHGERMKAEGAREANAKIARLTEATDMAINRLELLCDEAWNGDARDFKRSLVGVFAEYRAALQKNA